MKKFLSLALALALALMCCQFAVADGAGSGELYTIESLSTYPTTCTPDEARSMLMWQDFENMFAKYGVHIEFTYVDSDQYTTVLQARIASDQMPNLFVASNLDSAACINLVQQGKILAVDDCLEYSDGTAVYALSEEGYMYPCRQKDTFEDGKLYYLGQDSMLPSVYRTDDNFGWNCVTSNLYSLKVRQDWLDALNMEIPTTLDGFFDMLVAFRANDMNGNGVADERMVIPTGSCNTTWGGCFDNGITGWFGLANYVFQLNRVTKKAEVPFLQEGFVPYMQFLRNCVDAGVLYISDNVGKNNTELTSALAQDVVSAYFQRADIDWAGTPENAIYTTLGKIQGVEGIEPVMDGSVGQKAWDLRGFSYDTDPKAAAGYLDVVCSVDWSIFWAMGVEGKSFEVLDTGIHKFTAPTEKAEWVAYGYTSGENLLGGDGRLNRTALTAVYDTYNGGNLYWNSYDEFTSSDYFQEYYLASKKEHLQKNIMTWVGLAQDMQMYNMNGDLTMIAPMLTLEEAEVLDFYQTDLYTYMDELFANLLSGSWSLDDYDTYVQQLYDYGLQEVWDVCQARYDRINW